MSIGAQSLLGNRTTNYHQPRPRKPWEPLAPILPIKGNPAIIGRPPRSRSPNAIQPAQNHEMKPLYSVLFAILLLAVSPLQAAEKRIALVIGNSAYPTSPLTNPVNDARDIAAALRRLDFTVIEKTDASQKEMNRAIAQFGEKLTNDTVALFYYAGHGMQVKGKNYLIPVDAQITSEASARAETVDVDTVLDQLGHSPFNIVILDACRNNPFERRFRSTSGGLAQMDAPKGTLIAYATAPGKVASDGSGRNGLYTQELLKNLHTPGLPLEAVFKRVRNGVMQASGDAQTPWESSSLTGDFYFIFTGSATVKVQTSAAPATSAKRIKTDAEREEELWDSIKDTNRADTLNEYLKAYPKGRFIAQARVLLTRLRKDSAPIPTLKPEPVTLETRHDDIEDALWSEVQKGNSVEDYEAYLSQFSTGKYAALAKVRLRKRQEEGAAEGSRKDQDAWQTAENENNESAYRRYLKEWPAGQFAHMAQAKLGQLAELAAKQEQELWKNTEVVKDEKEIQALQNYLDKFPSGSHAKEARSKLAEIRNSSMLLGSWFMSGEKGRIWTYTFNRDGTFIWNYYQPSGAGLFGLSELNCPIYGRYTVSDNAITMDKYAGQCNYGRHSQTVQWSISGSKLTLPEGVYSKR